jgi:hypothetical protein
MPHSKPAVFGIYTNRKAVEHAVEKLHAAGFSKHDVLVVWPHQNLGELAHQTETKAVEGAEVGAGAGAILGGILGTLAGAGMLVIPGLGTVMLAGPVMTAVVAVGAMAGVGGLWGGLIGLGMTEKEARHYEGRLHKGDILLTIHCNTLDSMLSAKEVLIYTGAEDVYSRGPLGKVMEEVLAK